MMERKATIERNSKETQITAELNVDGTGITKINTPIKILDHMLDLFSFHGRFDLTIEVKGDTDIDIHHTNEDIGIVLGKLFKKALDELSGINRYGSAFAPMESTLGRTIVDICGRPHDSIQIVDLTGNGLKEIKDQDNYSIKYLEHFIESFAKGLGATIHVLIENPDEDLHTDIETVFKSLGMALDQATTIDPRRAGAVPSTKGIID
ncbi:MAG: imidazoleglycerol-phosphate dehydratase [Candidatus Omnitrophota bacterium]|jgi:imidazoleglycerol-phosphate dehydratase